jgi:hypothetical protein
MPRLRAPSLSCVLAACISLPMLAQTVELPTQSAAVNPNTIPEGTTFLVRLDDKLDTAKVKQGQRFKAKLAEDLVAPDGALIPRGKKIKGHVSSVEQGLHARMLLSFDQIDTNHGSMPLIATVTGVPGEHAAKQPGDEGTIERKGMSKEREMEAVLVGAGIGAGAGAAAHGGKGAAVGAGAGAGAGALAGFLMQHDLKLDKGTALEIRLDHPLQVPTH